MNEKPYFTRMVEKCGVQAVEKAKQIKEELFSAWGFHVIAECLNDLDKRLSEIEKQLKTKSV